MKISTYWIIILSVFACNNPISNQSLPEVENQHVADYIKSFQGRGDQADNTLPTPAQDALAHFQYPNDLQLDLVASEPLIVQPLSIKFDHRGRLWVVQYSQYPFPKGLKVVDYDYHLRAQFDKMPLPPPEGVQGADKITVLEDTNGDGQYDKATDAIEGLNIATSLTWGRGRIWVLNPPFLLAYPDPDGDGFPDGKPVVHLTGFGLEDTHAVANSLRWGPDGWLYGAQGSTTTATISSSVTKDVHFKGQAIWRYHPETEVFEIFAEGGGNTFFVEIDEKGRIYSGHNGAEARGQHYKQGAYYVKNWGKHGALTNPYAFGYFPHMKLEGDRLRFTHGFIKYEGNQLPKRYTHALIGINPLLNFLQVSSFQQHGSTFSNVDTEKILTTKDHWFRPVDLQTGPDGGIYIADWYDSRLSHIDPRDTWHKISGRIYRLAGKGITPPSSFDLSTYSTDQLIQLLSHPNKWYRQQALRLMGDQRDSTAIPKLTILLKESNPQTVLEALWAIHLVGGFDDQLAMEMLQHEDPHVRKWSVRLLGDQKEVSQPLANYLAEMALFEPHPEVRSQLAASAKRLPGKDALPIIQSLVTHSEDIDDPHIPLQIWWALEDKAESDTAEIVAWLSQPKVWEYPIVQQTLLTRLMQRFTMEGGMENWNTCTRLLTLSPTPTSSSQLLEGFWEGFRGKSIQVLPKDLIAAIETQQVHQKDQPFILGIKQGDKKAISSAISLLNDPETSLRSKLTTIQVLEETAPPESLPTLLNLVSSNQESPATRQAALKALKNYQSDSIGEIIVNRYPDQLRADPEIRLAALDLLVSSPEWALQLLHAITVSKRIDPQDIPYPLAQQMLLLDDISIQRAVLHILPELKPKAPKQKNAEIARIKRILQKKPGNPSSGKKLYATTCGSCHKLYGEGGNIGPDLTGYDRQNLDYLLLNIIDPNAEIREGYVNYLVRMKSGKTLMGVITHRDGPFITFKDYGGRQTVTRRQNLSLLEAQPISIMPEGLLTNLNEQEIRDLFAYFRH